MDKQKMRVDKWLWCVRIFKSRSKATDACKKGHISIEENRLKPSFLIKIGQIINVKKDGYLLTFKINDLLKSRVSAVLAQPCYDNLTPEEELNKFKNWYMGKAKSEFRERGEGRPTKKERREIDGYKDELYLDEWFDS
ncbi:RNA-binding S4 domain-containing protein [Saprospiraceae bacterium]|nr:RNA-binding S4 domain-containing protein [Saprospiraceae bacterium]